MLRTGDFSTRRILERMNEKVVCTTDDPTDSLEYHLKLKAERGFTVKVLPAFRPDKALGVESPREFNKWVGWLEASADLAVKSLDSFLEAMRRRNHCFHQAGCRLSDHDIERQINTLSNMGLLSRFVGMLTDSRSFLSYPRHEYFRRVLCNLLGNDVENGELPDDMELIGNMVKDFCFRNAVAYFGIEAG